MKLLQKLSLVVIVLLFFTAIGNAQSQRQVKDISQARSIAVSNTAIPVLLGVGANLLFDGSTIQKAGSWLLVYGLVMGPSGGNFYAEDYFRGTLGVAARVGGGILLQNATREIFGKNISESLGWDDEKVSIEDREILIGGGLFIGSMIYNVVSAKASVDRYNRKLGYNVRLNPNIRDGQFVPMISATINF